MAFFKKLAKKVPGLPAKLKQVGIYDEPEEYVKKIFMTSFFLSTGFTLVLFAFFKSILLFLLIFVITPFVFFYLINYVEVKIKQLKRKIDEEIIFAGRFLIIELQSGVPIYKAFENIQKNYEVVGSYFGDIINKVYLGTNIEMAINDTLLNTPSSNLRRLLWQVMNSIKTGSDAAPALNTVIDQIVREQEIAVKEYGKKLNPMAMFYMMMSVIFPSLGTTMLVVVATFMDLQISLIMLLALAAMIGFIQFMFMSTIRTLRPPISMQ